ncbi:hypothetical protein CHUAL_014035 [Chamberlinius hualienensis]
MKKNRYMNNNYNRYIAHSHRQLPTVTVSLCNLCDKLHSSLGAIFIATSQVFEFAGNVLFFHRVEHAISRQSIVAMNRVPTITEMFENPIHRLKNVSSMQESNATSNCYCESVINFIPDDRLYGLNGVS